VELIGADEGSGYKETPYLARLGDGGVVQLTELLFLVLREVVGRHDAATLAERVTESLGRKVTADNVAFLLEKKLQPLGVLAEPDGSAPAVSKPDPLLALKLKTVLVPERAVGWLTALFRPLFWPPVVLAVLVAFGALDVWYFGVHGVAQGIRSTLYQPGLILLVYGLLVASVAWHEVGHATACRYGGARPGVIGFGVYVVWPAFYTDVTDAYRLGKGGRIRTDLGGIYFNMIFALGTAGAYFVTRFEPLLIVVLMQHLLILYQFMPFLRLDGYYVVSDLTGVPDLFGRIKPVLASLVPWKRSGEAVRQLKPWVRVVVTLWVLAVIPILSYGFVTMVTSAPRVIATGYDSFLVQWDRASGALDAGRTGAAAAGGLQIAMLALPFGGMAVTTARVAKRIGGGALRASRGRPVVRTFLVTALLGVAAAVAFVLLPNGEYRPIQPGEKGTIQGSLTAATQMGSGRPGLTEQRAGELGGAPRVSDGGAPLDPAEHGGTPESEPGVVPEDDGQEEEEHAPVSEESPTPEEAEPSPTYVEPSPTEE
jgi:putative peptide zinc metalloprotease protein